MQSSEVHSQSNAALDAGGAGRFLESSPSRRADDDMGASSGTPLPVLEECRSGARMAFSNTRALPRPRPRMIIEPSTDGGIPTGPDGTLDVDWLADCSRAAGAGFSRSRRSPSELLSPRCGGGAGPRLDSTRCRQSRE